MLNIQYLKTNFYNYNEIKSFKLLYLPQINFNLMFLVSEIIPLTVFDYWVHKLKRLYRIIQLIIQLIYNLFNLNTTLDVLNLSFSQSKRTLRFVEDDRPDSYIYHYPFEDDSIICRKSLGRTNDYFLEDLFNIKFPASAQTEGKGEYSPTAESRVICVGL